MCNMIHEKTMEIVRGANPEARKINEALRFLLNNRAKGTLVSDFVLVAETIREHHPQYIDAFFDILFFNVKFI